MKSIKFTILTILLFSIILISNVKPAYAAPVNKRLWGNDRYGTCSAIVQDGWLGNSEYAVIVNGENFPDALSASTLAKKYNAPILLTQSNALNDNAYNQLKRLNVKQAFIVGGDFVVEPVVEQTIKSMGIQTTRYEGNDRDETSVKVAEQIGTDNGIILTTDSDFTDALSVSSIAAKLQIPIILMPKDRVPNSVKSFISGKNISKTYVLGDNNVINDSVVSQFPNVQRITGEDKFQRNINIINAFLNEFNFNTIYLAYSENFPDALSGSAIAALNGNPIILIGNSSSDVSSNFIRNKLNLINQINILGGTAGIKDDELNTILNNKTGLIGKYWSGCYYATQGKTALTLTINNISDDGTISDALFEFGPLEENPGVPNGSYQMSGKMNKIDNTIDLTGVKWINQPTGYDMVDIHGKLDLKNHSITGCVSGPGVIGKREGLSINYVDSATLSNLTEAIGTWSGYYYATQGKTALTLTINSINDDGTSNAIFSFGPLVENPGVLSGSFQMSGKINKINNSVDLTGVKWINQPSGYSMIDIHGKLDLKNHTITGNKFSLMYQKK